MIRILADTRQAKQHWERRTDQFPYLMIPMSDGSTVRYIPEIRQPRPYFKDQLDRFSEICIGYKRAGDSATSTGGKD